MTKLLIYFSNEVETEKSYHLFETNQQKANIKFFS